MTLPSGSISLRASLPHVEVEFAVRPEGEGVHLVVVIPVAAHREKLLHFVRVVAAGRVRQQPDIRRRGYDDLGPFGLRQHADAERRLQLGRLPEGRLFIHTAGAFAVFEDHDPVAFRPQPVVSCGNSPLPSPRSARADRYRCSSDSGSAARPQTASPVSPGATVKSFICPCAASKPYGFSSAHTRTGKAQIRSERERGGSIAGSQDSVERARV